MEYCDTQIVLMQRCGQVKFAVVRSLFWLLATEELLLTCSARSDQYDSSKEALLTHVVESFRVRQM